VPLGAVGLVLALVLVACTGDEAPALETAVVSRGEVVQTVAAAAMIEPAGVVTVTAPVSGQIEELFVSDGDEVTAGDPLVRLSSETIDEQIAQAEAAVTAAGALSELQAGAGLDLAPVVGAFRTQFDSLLPALLGVLQTQVDATEAALVGVLETAAQATSEASDRLEELQAEADRAAASRDELALSVAAALSADRVPAVRPLVGDRAEARGRASDAADRGAGREDAAELEQRLAELDPAVRELLEELTGEPLDELVATAAEVRDRATPRAPGEPGPDAGAAAAPSAGSSLGATLAERIEDEVTERAAARDQRAGGPALDGGRLDDAVDEARGQAAEARAQLVAAEASFQQVALDLRRAEQAASQQTDQAAAAQAAALDAQLAQAQAALDAARALTEDLTIVAPTAGTVELARGGEAFAAATPDVSALAGALGDGPGLGDVAGLLGGAIGPSSVSSGPIEEGAEVAVGQPLLSLYDLSSFRATVEVDEIDAVEVQAGQAVTVLVDAFPAAELAGVVDRIAIAPERGATGGAVFPVEVRFTRVPPEVGLRVGLTASAEIETRRVDGDLVVPTSALLRRGGAEVVYAVRDGRAAEVPVRVLAIGDDTAAIDGELSLGEPVVTIGVELVEDGDEVDV
jgi:HlyD family secretion protein